MTQRMNTRRITPPEVWAEARAAWEAGETAQSVCSRFGVGLDALWKRRAAENWSRAAPEPPTVLPPGPTLPAVTRVETRLVEAAHGGEGGGGLGPKDDPLHPAFVAAAARACLRPVDYEPEMLLRSAMAGAAIALKRGDGAEARRLARAAGEIADLRDRLDIRPTRMVEEVDAADSEWRTEMMMGFISRMALRLGRQMAEGRPLPPLYQAALEAMDAEDAKEAAEAFGQKAAEAAASAGPTTTG